jgi:uncharacterized membrane protein YvbJ
VIRCAACGTENPEGATYCSKCARKLDAETQQSVAQRRAEHTATAFNWTAAALAAILIIVIVVVVLVVAVHGI